VEDLPDFQSIAVFREATTTWFILLGTLWAFSVFLKDNLSTVPAGSARNASCSSSWRRRSSALSSSSRWRCISSALGVLQGVGVGTAEGVGPCPWELEPVAVDEVG